MLAPMMTPTAWYKLIRPALTKPTTITVVALLLCIIAVTIVPTKAPLSGFVMALSKNDFNREPAAFSSPSPINSIPNKNRASPLNRPSKILMYSIQLPPNFILFHHTTKSSK